MIYALKTPLKSTLRLWIGRCCPHCQPNATRLIFEGVTTDELTSMFYDDYIDIFQPLFRAASEEEIIEHSLDVPDGATAYCVVTSHGEGQDGPKVSL